jgi:protein FRA10AC1
VLKFVASRSRRRTWEVDFGYVEAGEKKNALVKVRLCPDCSYKINYRHKRKEVTKRKKDKKKKRKSARNGEDDADELDPKVSKMRAEVEEKKQEANAKEIWKAPLDVEQERSREEDFSEYLEDLFM